MLLVDASKIIILNVLKIQIVIAPLVAILFCFYPEFGKGMKGDRIVVNMYFNDQFKNCQLPEGVSNGEKQPFFHCPINGTRHTFEVMNKDAKINVYYAYINLHALSDSPEDTIKLNISTTDCSRMIKIVKSAISNASLPVLANDCNSVQNVIVEPLNIISCWIREISSKPQLSGELFPVKWEDAVMVNLGSVVTFDCGDNKQQSSKCIKEDYHYIMSPEITNDCPTPKQDTTSTTSTSTTPSTTSTTSTTQATTESSTIKSTRSETRSTTKKLQSRPAKTKDDVKLQVEMGVRDYIGQTSKQLQFVRHRESFQFDQQSTSNPGIVKLDLKTQQFMPVIYGGELDKGFEYVMDQISIGFNENTVLWNMLKPSIQKKWDIEIRIEYSCSRCMKIRYAVVVVLVDVDERLKGDNPMFAVKKNKVLLAPDSIIPYDRERYLFFKTPFNPDLQKLLEDGQETAWIVINQRKEISGKNKKLIQKTIEKMKNV